MAQIIPMTDEGCRRATVSTAAGVLILRSYYMPLSESWLLDIFDSSGTLLVGGIALITKIDNLLKGTGDRFDGYSLRVVSQTNRENNSPDSLGGDCQLILYEPGEEVPDVYGG